LPIAKLQTNFGHILAAEIKSPVIYTTLNTADKKIDPHHLLVDHVGCQQFDDSL